MDIKDVEKLAELARIELSQAEKEALLSDMKGVLDYVKVIEGVEVDGEEVEYETYNVWREDLPRVAGEELFSREIITDQFPDSQDGFLKVKKIL